MLNRLFHKGTLLGFAALLLLGSVTAASGRQVRTTHS